MAPETADSILERMRALENGEKTLGRVQLEATSAQRLLNDEAFWGFLNEMQGNAINLAVFSENPTDRELGRVKVLIIEELRGRIVHAAGYAEERREQETRAKSFE